MKNISFPLTEEMVNVKKWAARLDKKDHNSLVSKANFDGRQEPENFDFNFDNWNSITYFENYKDYWPCIRFEFSQIDLTQDFLKKSK